MTQASDAPERAEQLPGVDRGPVTRWIADHVPDVLPPLDFHLIAGGRSNLTFRVVDRNGRALALRRPPVSHVLPTAHDMGREYRVIKALGDTPVPVPVALGLCDDERVNGRPFYVMSFVEGRILRDRAAAEAAYDETTRARIGPDMADTLAALHAVDVDAVGLGDLGRREGYIERQLRRWTRQYHDMHVEGVDHGGLVEKVGDALARSIPPQQATSIVHGDYRLDNVVLDERGAVAAILDWEICTLGDPMADVGLLMVYWTEPGDTDSFLGIAAPTTTPGFSSRAEILDRYALSSTLDLSTVPYYMAFGYWKLACILQGVYARYVAGAGAGDKGSVEQFPQTVQHLAELAAQRLDES